MRKQQPDTVRQRHGEEGSAIIVAVILMAILMTVTLSAASARVAGARSADSHETQQDEYWGARSAAAAVEASLRSDIPAAYDSDVQRAKQFSAGRKLPSFDSHDVPAVASKPVMRTDGERSPYDLAECTSLLGQIDSWAAARAPVAEDYARQLGYNAKVAVLREAFRPQLSGSGAYAEPAYALEFYIDAAAGAQGRVRPSGLVLLGPAVEGCATAVTLATSPSTITQGDSATLVVTYENATRVVVKDQAGNTVAARAVTESAATQSLSITVSPSATTTYSATATNGTGCQADSAARTLTVLIPPPQVLSFAANPPCIIAGGSSILSWSIQGATAATINGTPVSPTSGTMQVSPTTTTSYTLVASNSSGTVQAQVTVQVSSPPKVNLLAAEPSCVVSGGSTVLRWNVSDAAAVTINGTPVDPASGSMTVTPTADTTYTLVATGAGCAPQTVQAQVTVGVATPPQINQFTAAPASVVKGSGASSTLQWDVTGATSATINGTPVNPASGLMQVSPSATTVYTLVVTGGGCAPQQRQAQVTVTVDDPPPLACPAVGFTATPDCIVSGQGSQLQWSVTDADAVTIDGTPVALSGSLSVTPSATTVYTLVASRTGCTPRQSQVTVQVSRPPAVTSFGGAASTIRQGQSEALQWSVVDAVSVTIDGAAVDPSSGTMTVSPTSTHTYTLVATGGGCAPQQRQATFTVNVTPCPSINFFDATRGSIFPGGTTDLQWSVSDAVGVTINGSPVGQSGSLSVSPASTTSYRLVAQSAGGGCDVEQTITVTVAACAAPQVTSFTADPPSVTSGGNQLVRLSWSVAETTGTGVSVTISPGVGTFNAGDGFVDITQPAATTTYTAVATNGCGASSSAQTAVTVNQPPTVRGWQGDNAVTDALAEAELDATLTENADGSVTVQGDLSSLGISDNFLADEITLTLSKGGNQFFTTNPAVTVLTPGGFPIHHFDITVPAAQVPPGAAAVDMLVKANVAGTLGLFQSGYNLHVSIDTTLPCGAQVPGDDPPFAFSLAGIRTGQYVKPFVGAPDPQFLFKGCN